MNACKSLKGSTLYKADEVKFPDIPGNCAMTINSSQSLEMYEDGYTNPNLLRIHEEHPVEFAASDKDTVVTFDPYNGKPQFELKPRSYLFYILGLNSYRLTTYCNHDEDSEFWERP